MYQPPQWEDWYVAVCDWNRVQTLCLRIPVLPWCSWLWCTEWHKCHTACDRLHTVNIMVLQMRPNFCGSQTTVYSNREEPCGKCNKIIIFPLLSPDVNTCHWRNWKSIHYPSLDANVMYYENIAIFCRLNPFTPKSDQCQILLQPHQKYYITQYGELGFPPLHRRWN